MKLSLACLSIQRRLPSEIIESAKAKISEGVKSSDAFYSELPQVLQRFFEKYPPSPFRQYSKTPTLTNAPDANPFLANKHPITQKWHNPKYSMRRQADIYKAAYRFGITHLLPNLMHNRKFYEDKYNEGVKVRGAHQFKLTAKERLAPEREKEVKEAVAGLDAKILERKGKRYAEFLKNKK